MPQLDVSEDQAYLIMMFAQSVLSDETAPYGDRKDSALLFHQANRVMGYPVEGEHISI